MRRRQLGSRGMLLLRQSASHYKPSSPARSAPAVWWLDRIRIQAAAGDQPRDHRVGVPHLAGGRLVPAPNWRREGGHQVKQSACTVCVIRQPPRAIDRLADIRDDTIAPATHLVAEDPKAPCPARTNRATSAHATPRSVTARDGRLLDHEASLRHAHLKRGVVEITRRPMLAPRHHRFDTRPLRRTKWPPAPNGNQYRSTPATDSPRPVLDCSRSLVVIQAKALTTGPGRYSAADVLRISLGQRLAVRALRVPGRRRPGARRDGKGGVRRVGD
jgi:hypothetical protein